MKASPALVIVVSSASFYAYPCDANVAEKRLTSCNYIPTNIITELAELIASGISLR